MPRDRQEGYLVEFAVTFSIFYIHFIVLSVVKEKKISASKVCKMKLGGTKNTETYIIIYLYVRDM